MNNLVCEFINHVLEQIYLQFRFQTVIIVLSYPSASQINVLNVEIIELMKNLDIMIQFLWVKFIIPQICSLI